MSLRFSLFDVAGPLPKAFGFAVENNNKGGNFSANTCFLVNIR